MPSLNICVLFGVTFVVSYGISKFLDLDFLAVLLAFAPGGVAEMCLIALSLNVDPSFVAFHHLARISLILLMAPMLGAWMTGKNQ